MYKSKRSIYNLIFYIISLITTILFGLIVPRVILVYYGSETNGLLSSVSQFVVYLSLFEAGIQAVAIQSLYKPVHDNDTKTINGILSAVNINYKKVSIGYFFALIGLSILYPLLANSNENFWVVFAVVFFSGFGNVVLFWVQGKYSILLQTEGKMYIITFIQTIITILSNTAKIILLLAGFNIAFVVLAGFIVSLLQAVYLTWYVKRKYKWIDLTEKPVYSALAQKNAALIHQVSGLIFQNTDVLVLTVFCDLKVVSVYSVYKLVVGHISSLLNTLFNSISFALGQLYNTNRSKYSEVINTVEVWLNCLVFATYSITTILLVPFIKLYTRGVNDIAYADYTLAFMFIAAELMTLGRTTMLNTINYAGHFKNTLKQTIIESVINLSVSISSVFFFGIYGCLIGTIAALLYRTTDIIIYSNTKLLGRSPLKTFAIQLLDYLLLIVILALSWVLNIQIDSWVDFLKYGAMCSAIIYPAFFLLNIVAHKGETKMLIELVKNKNFKSVKGRKYQPCHYSKTKH